MFKRNSYHSFSEEFQTVIGVMAEILPKEPKIGDVGCVPNDGTREKVAKSSSTGSRQWLSARLSSLAMCGVTTTDPLGSQSRGRLDDVLGQAWFPHMPG